MPFVRDVTLTTTLFGPVSLVDQKTGLGRKLAEWLKPTLTVDMEYLGAYDVAPWGKAQPIGMGVILLVAVGLFFLIRRRS